MAKSIPPVANAPLNTFLHALDTHKWSFETDNYFDYIQAVKKEQTLFVSAQMFSKPGVDDYRLAQQKAIDNLARLATQRAVDAVTREMDHLVNNYYKKEIERLRATYMKPIDFFEEKLNRHDWYYAFSDDAGVYRRGNDNEKALQEEAKAAGPEFVQLLLDYQRRVNDNIRKGPGGDK